MKEERPSSRLSALAAFFVLFVSFVVSAQTR